MVISVIAETMRQSLHIRTCSFYCLPLARQHKETIQYLTSTVQDLMLLKYPHIGPQSIILEVISVISVVISVISLNRRTAINLLSFLFGVINVVDYFYVCIIL